MFKTDWIGLWASFRRSWVHSTGMQMATLATLSAAYGVVAFALTASFNLKQILSTWGESVEISAYLRESDDADLPTRARAALEALADAASVEHVPKEKASELFRAQMASYAPDLLGDKEFANPFPASFRVKIKPESRAATDAGALETLAGAIQKIEGVEDVSYGQSWVKNYAGFVRAASAGGWALAIVLGAGALFVIGNSIRASIASRRDEIEILELVGATSGAVRAPYVFEGAAMGFAASAIALGANFAAWLYEERLLRESMAAVRLLEKMSFLSPLWIGAALIGGTGLGALGAFLIVRSINDGWAASQRQGGAAAGRGAEA